MQLANEMKRDQSPLGAAQEVTTKKVMKNLVARRE